MSFDVRCLTGHHTYVSLRLEKFSIYQLEFLQFLRLFCTDWAWSKALGKTAHHKIKILADFPAWFLIMLFMKGKRFVEFDKIQDDGQ